MRNGVTSNKCIVSVSYTHLSKIYYFLNGKENGIDIPFFEKYWYYLQEDCVSHDEATLIFICLLYTSPMHLHLCSRIIRKRFLLLEKTVR